MEKAPNLFLMQRTLPNSSVQVVEAPFKAVQETTELHSLHLRALRQLLYRAVRQMETAVLLLVQLANLL
jgi:hypothetical protein